MEKRKEQAMITLQETAVLNSEITEKALKWTNKLEKWLKKNVSTSKHPKAGWNTQQTQAKIRPLQGNGMAAISKTMFFKTTY